MISPPSGFSASLGPKSRAILLGEQAIQVLLGIPVGMVLGTWGARALLELQADPEQFRMPMLISSQTYAFSAVVVLAAAVLSALLVRRRLDTLDLVGVLKTREVRRDSGWLSDLV